MKSGSLVFILGLISLVLIDFIWWMQIRTFLKKKWHKILFYFQALFFIVLLVLFQYLVNHLQTPKTYFWMEKMIGILVLIYSPKFAFVLLSSIGIMLRNWNRCYAKFFKKIGIILSIGLFIILLYSLTYGRYHYKLKKTAIPITNLSPVFQDFKIIQLSDLHLGSFGESYQGLTRLVDQVNALEPDLIVFTGDMVNNFATEMTPWIETLQRLKATYGKYAVTGNHDYGDYTHWKTPNAKRKNLEQFFLNMRASGFYMLNNSSIPITKQGDTLWLAGVENCGKPPFSCYGKLEVALASIPAHRPIILLSHDPSHWQEEILKYPVHLTLSGHTHAMQMGIEIGSLKWSPAQYLYSEYDGLYQKGEQYLYVSRGQGYLGFPGRIGIRPSITLISLTPQ